MAWGKIIGGVVGAAMGGPIGAGIGVALGAGWDSSEDEPPDADSLRRLSTDAPFTVSQSGNVLCLTSRLLTPDPATHAVVRIAQGGHFVRSRVGLLSDDDGDFGIRKRILERTVTVEVPVHALEIAPEVAVTLQYLVLFFSGDVFIGQVIRPIEVRITRESWSTVRWLHPVVDMMAHYALLSGPWTSGKVRLLRDLFTPISGSSPDELQAMRDRLKLSPRPTIEHIQDALTRRFDNDVLARTVVPMAAVTMEETALHPRWIRDEIERLCEIFSLDDDDIEDVLRQLKGYPPEWGDDGEEDRWTGGHEQPHRGPETQDQDLDWARETLGIGAAADRAAIQRAWRAKISELHPDKYASLPESVRALINAKAQEINRARDLLLD